MTGVLLLHGFAGARKELEPLRAHLENSGFIVSVPLLKGYEFTCKELSKSKHIDWIGSGKQS